jgi:hypothetical protein
VPPLSGGGPPKKSGSEAAYLNIVDFPWDPHKKYAVVKRKFGEITGQTLDNSDDIFCS